MTAALYVGLLMVSAWVAINVVAYVDHRRGSALGAAVFAAPLVVLVLALLVQEIGRRP